MPKLLIFDIDGVLTDGSILVDETGREQKTYNLTEIDTLGTLRQSGYLLAAITGESTPIVDVFKKKILWDAFLCGYKEKVAGIKEFETQFNVSPTEICYIGDGKYDVPAIQYAGLGVAPANAIPEAKRAADIVLTGRGGKDCIQCLKEVLDRLREYDAEYRKEDQSANSLNNHKIHIPKEILNERLCEKVKYYENTSVNKTCREASSMQFEANTSKTAMDRFNITDRIVIITGGAGLMGVNHAEAVLSGGGVPVLLDISADALVQTKARLTEKYPGADVVTFKTDITNKAALTQVCDELVQRFGHVDVLINNAANNPKVEGNAKNMGAISFPEFPLDSWHADIAVGLTGALLCSQVFGQQMALQGFGVILNISSDLGVIAPDQRIYRKEGLKEEEQTVKPVTYSVVKHGLIGLTKYIAKYWAQKGVRCNALCPAGIENGQDEGFIRKLTNLVPMGRMATKDEYQSTVLYMISDASAYMTGATVIVDGGRTCW